MKNIARWVLIVPAAVLGWYVALITGLLLSELIDSVCPTEYQVSGHCMLSWGGIAQDTVVVLGASLAAVLVVGFATLMAPSHKAVVAWTTYAVGAVIASIGFYVVESWIPFLGALICGFVAAAYIHRRQRRTLLPNNALH